MIKKWSDDSNFDHKSTFSFLLPKTFGHYYKLITFLSGLAKTSLIAITWASHVALLSYEVNSKTIGVAPSTEDSALYNNVTQLNPALVATQSSFMLMATI